MSGSRNVAEVDQALAEGSIEQITAMALKAEAEKAAGGEQAGVKQDVQASSGQTQGNAEEEARLAAEAEQARAKGGDSSKEVNFAKLRTKVEAQERELARLAEENRRLAESRYVAELPADHAQKVAEVDARLAEIGSKFQDGDITFEEMQAQTRAAQAEREELLAASIKVQIANEMKAQREAEAAAKAAAEAEAAKKSWVETVDGFFNSKPDGVDYDADKEKSGALNTYVKALGADPDNADKPHEWFLKTAHDLVKTKFGIASAKPAAKVDEQSGDPAAPIRTLSDLPGGIPAARSEVEQVDQLSGAALANRFAGMSDEQINAELAKFG